VTLKLDEIMEICEEPEKFAANEVEKLTL